MTCRNCKNEHAYSLTTFLVEGVFNDRCDRCGDSNRGSISPDVWYGYGSGTHTEENIAYPNGHPQAGQPIPFWDKSSKKRAMEQAGVREAGDRKHGARHDSSMAPKNRRTYFI